jgi:hypothetical protein
LKRINHPRRLIDYKKKLDHSRVKKSHASHLVMIDCLLDDIVKEAAYLLGEHLDKSGKDAAPIFNSLIHKS